MAIQYIGANQASGASVAVPTHQAGDLIVVFTYRTGSTTPASVPAPTGDWTNVNSSGANNNAGRVAYRFAPGPGTETGTWTNATHIHVMVFRGVSTTNPIGASAVAGAASATITASALTLQRQDNTSVVVNFLGHSSTTTNLGAPTGLTQRSKQGATGTQSQGSSTPATVDRWTAVTLAAGTSGNWRSHTIELREEPPATGFISATKAGGWFTTYNHPVPLHVAPDDLMVMFASANSADTLTTPTGWTLHNRQQNGSGTATWVFTKIAATETTPYTLTWNGEHWHRSQLLLFRGYTGIKTLSVTVGETLTTADLPVVSANAGDMHLGFGFQWTNTTKSFPSPPKTVLTELDNAGGVSVYEHRSSAGNTPAYTFTTGTSGRITMYSILLEPPVTTIEVDATAFGSVAALSNATPTVQRTSTAPGFTGHAALGDTSQYLSAAAEAASLDTEASLPDSDAGLHAAAVTDGLSASASLDDASLIARFAAASAGLSTVASSDPTVTMQGFTAASLEEVEALFEETEAELHAVSPAANLVMHVDLVSDASVGRQAAADALSLSATYDVTESAGLSTEAGSFTVNLSLDTALVDGSNWVSAEALVSGLVLGPVESHAALHLEAEPLEAEAEFSDADAGANTSAFTGGLDLVAFTGTATVKREFDFSIYITVQSKNTIIPDATTVTPLPTLDMPTIIDDPTLTTMLPSPGLLTELDDYGVATTLPGPGIATVIPAFPGTNTEIENPPTTTQLPNPGLNTISPELS